MKGLSRRAALTRKSTVKVFACMERFRKELSPEGKKALDEFFNKEMQLADISEQDAFVRGVRIGARFILDVIGEYRSQLPQVNEFL